MQESSSQFNLSRFSHKKLALEFILGEKNEIEIHFTNMATLLLFLDFRLKECFFFNENREIDFKTSLT